MSETLPRDLISKIKSKILRCKEEINRHKRFFTRTHNPNATFSFAKANILILFLEATALQDMELVNDLQDQLEPLRMQLLGLEDYTIISAVRKEHLIHRKKNVNTVYKCCDLKEFIKDKISNAELFKKLEKYLDQMIDRLDGKDTNEIMVTSFFHSKEHIDKIVKQKLTMQEVKEYLSKTFLKFTQADFYSSFDRRQIMFEMVVNVVPLLENLDRYKKIEEFRYIEHVKNELLHRFHIFRSDMSRQFELRKYVENMKPVFFKFFFSHKVDQLLIIKRPADLELEQTFSDTLQKFRYVVNEFNNPSGHFTFQFIASKLEKPETSLVDPLRNFISNYVKIMLFFDNEYEIKRREGMQSKIPHRYDLQSPELRDLPRQYDRPSDMRLYIYENINKLKKSCRDPVIHNELVAECKRSLRNRCGILGKEFESILDLYVKGNQRIDDGKFIDRIFSDIFTISEIKADKDLKFDTIIDFYEKRGSSQPNPGSAEDKFRNIEQGEKFCIKVSNDEKEVCTDKFVVNILGIFDRVESQYRNVFNNVEEAVCDQTFLSILTLNNQPSEEYWTNLLKTKCFSPYAAELILRDNIKNTDGLISRGLVTYDEFKGIIENLLENKLFAPQIKKFFCLSESKLSKILCTQDQNSQVEPLTIHKLICQSLDEMNVGNVYCLLTHDDFRKEFLNEIKVGGLGLESQRFALKILILLCKFSKKLISDKDHKSASNVLLVAHSLDRSMGQNAAYAQVASLHSQLEQRFQFF